MEVVLQKDIAAEEVKFSSFTSAFGDVNSLSTLHDNTQKELENHLLEKVRNGEQTAYFTLGQLYFEQSKYDKAALYFERSKGYDIQSRYQLGIIYYDGLGCRPKPIKGIQHLLAVATSAEPKAKHIIHAAQYNVGRACFQGHGVPNQSDSDAEKWWLLAANDGDPRASVKAQSTLGLFYSSPDHFDIEKAFFWHSEACGNGSVESQGAIGVMYLFGIGVRKCLESAYICLKDASERGNLYAMGVLAFYYHQIKLYTKCADLAHCLSKFDDEDAEEIARETDCQVHYVRKAISLACFLYARCLSEGTGVQTDLTKSAEFYSKSFRIDPDICALLQDHVTHGII